MREYIDEYGKWNITEDGLMLLIEPSQRWLDEHPAPEPAPAPDPDAITAEEALAILLGGDAT